MNRVWETHRGDEWWYQDYWCKASASRAANIVSISYDSISQGQLNDERLHEFLWLSWKKFGDEKIFISISNSVVSNVLSNLASQGIVEFEKVTSSHSKEARINIVKPYEKPVVNLSISKKKWWQFW